MVRNPVDNRKTFSSELLFSLMQLLLRLGRGKLASGQWPVWIPKFTQPRHARVGVEIHYLTLASGFKSFSPILFMHMHRTSCFFNRDLANTMRPQRRRENGVDVASYFHMWMLPRHFHVVFDVASCLRYLSNVKPGYHAYIYMYGNFSAPRLLLFLWQS